MRVTNSWALYILLDRFWKDTRSPTFWVGERVVFWVWFWRWCSTSRFPVHSIFRHHSPTTLFHQALKSFWFWKTTPENRSPFPIRDATFRETVHQSINTRIATAASARSPYCRELPEHHCNPPNIPMFQLLKHSIFQPPLPGKRNPVRHLPLSNQTASLQ